MCEELKRMVKLARSLAERDKETYYVIGTCNGYDITKEKQSSYKYMAEYRATADI